MSKALCTTCSYLHLKVIRNYLNKLFTLYKKGFEYHYYNKIVYIIWIYKFNEFWYLKY